MIPAIGAYAIMGVMLAVMSLIVIDDIDAPPGSAPAIMFLVGLLWPS